jgi:hypothetical protein
VKRGERMKQLCDFYGLGGFKNIVDLIDFRLLIPHVFGNVDRDFNFGSADNLGLVVRFVLGFVHRNNLSVLDFRFASRANTDFIEVTHC